jgi:hypothetical protein
MATPYETTLRVLNEALGNAQENRYRSERQEAAGKGTEHEAEWRQWAESDRQRCQEITDAIAWVKGRA